MADHYSVRVTCGVCGDQKDYYRKQSAHSHDAQGEFVLAARQDMLAAHAACRVRLNQISNDTPKQKQSWGQIRMGSTEI